MDNLTIGEGFFLNFNIQWENALLRDFPFILFGFFVGLIYVAFSQISLL